MDDVESLLSAMTTAILLSPPYTVPIILAIIGYLEGKSFIPVMLLIQC